MVFHSTFNITSCSHITGTAYMFRPRLRGSVMSHLVVVSSISGWGEVSFQHIFASHLCRSMWEKKSVALERKVVLVLRCQKARKYMCITNCHDMTLAVKVALNPNTTNQLHVHVFPEFQHCQATALRRLSKDTPTNNKVAPTRLKPWLSTLYCRIPDRDWKLWY